MLHLVKLLMLGSLVLSMASATTITFTALPGVQMSYTGTPNTGTYNGFWTATVDGKTGVKLICDDITHTTPSPVAGPYNYNVSVIDGPNPLQNARWASDPYTATQLTKYRAAAILVNDLLALGASATAVQITNYQYALWDLFNPYSTNTIGAQDTLKNNALTVAGGTVTPQLAAIYASLRVYTPVGAEHFGSASPQEFLGWSPVPEPSQFVALFGALGLGWFVRRRRKA